MGPGLSIWASLLVVANWAGCLSRARSLPCRTVCSLRSPGCSRGWIGSAVRALEVRLGSNAVDTQSSRETLSNSVSRPCRTEGHDVTSEDAADTTEFELGKRVFQRLPSEGSAGQTQRLPARRAGRFRDTPERGGRTAAGSRERVRRRHGGTEDPHPAQVL
jgi:hypothetical protein